MKASHCGEKNTIMHQAMLIQVHTETYSNYKRQTNNDAHQSQGAGEHHHEQSRELKISPETDRL